MSRYIDADKLTEAFVKAAKQVGNIGDQIAFRMMINDIPTADVRKNIKAQKVIGGGEHDGATCWFECSHCHGSVDIEDAYCKHCGALLEFEK